MQPALSLHGMVLQQHASKRMRNNILKAEA